MENLLSTSLMVSAGKLLTECMWSPQHFKCIYFLNKNIGEQSLLPTAKFQVCTLLPLSPSFPPPGCVESSFSYRRGLLFTLLRALRFSPTFTLSRPCHVTRFIPFYPSTPIERNKQKPGFQALALTNLLTLSKSLNFSQPRFLHL